MAKPPKQLSTEASQLADKFRSDFYEAMMSQAQNLANKRNDELILSNHIREARDFVLKDENNKNRTKIIVSLVSSTLFGVTLPSFFTELSGLTATPPTGKLFLVILYFLSSLITLALSIYLSDINNQ